MYVLHQIVNMLINPVFVVLLLLAAGLAALLKRRSRLGVGLVSSAMLFLFLLSWPPVVDAAGWALERDYPVVRAEDFPAADAIVVLGGGVGIPPEEVGYPYPLLADGADRVWFGAKLWHAQRAKHGGRPVKVYCTGPDVGRSTLPVLSDLGVDVADVVAQDSPRNTEQEARTLEGELSGKTVLLVTSAMHMRRATRIFAKYAPAVKVVPAATDHHFFNDPGRFRNPHYWLPSLSAFSGAASVEHEIVGLLRYAW